MICHGDIALSAATGELRSGLAFWGKGKAVVSSFSPVLDAFELSNGRLGVEGVIPYFDKDG